MSKPKKSTTIKRNSISTTVKHVSTRKAKKDAKRDLKVSHIKQGLGVIDTIVAVLQAGGGTIPEITKAVRKKLRDRKAEQLGATVRAQMARLKLAKAEGGRGLKVKREKQEGTNQLLYSL